MLLQKSKLVYFGFDLVFFVGFDVHDSQDSSNLFGMDDLWCQSINSS